MNGEDDFPIPMTIQPEDLFEELREQREATRLAEGLLRYTDLPVTLSDEIEEDDAPFAID